ncbi:hypothetical protein BC826DRAFT_1109669 [Russula brevipes]|nr:hypothetical protein BC826DRAFT_1109669 [Russula brevipes]
MFYVEGPSLVFALSDLPAHSLIPKRVPVRVRTRRRSLLRQGRKVPKAVVTALVDSLVPTGYIRFAPDGYFVFAAFASAFMLKLLRPECSRFITPVLETDFYQTIERLINTNRISADGD